MKKFICTLMIFALVVVPALTLSVSAAIPYNNMIALYNMEGNLKESISGKDGTIMNGATFVNDSSRGSVLYLNNDDVVSPGQGLGYDQEGQHAILADSHIPNSDTMTISIWFKAKELRTWARVIDLGDARAETMDSPNRFINISPTNGEYTIGTVNVNDGADAGFDVPNNRDRVFADLVSPDEWIHAVLVIDAKDGKPNVLYLNGKAFESTSGGSAGDPSNPSTFSPKDILAAVDGIGKTYLGRSRYENNGDQIFNGYVDDVAIFDVALTADQVAELNKVDFKAGNPATAAAPVEEAPAAAPEAEAAPVPAAVSAPAPTAAPSSAPATGVSAVLAIFSTLGAAVTFAKIRKSK